MQASVPVSTCCLDDLATILLVAKLDGHATVESLA